MSEIEQLSLSNLLSQVGIIKNKYDDLATYTGENYNIFNVLGVYHHELSHSAIIGDLLNAKGKHGQKDTFLKLFLEELTSFNENSEQNKVLQKFQSQNSQTHIEKHIGKVNFEKGEGGRIDILLNDGKNNIIIENKVWAGDQYLQLVRYNNQDKNAPIIYLTLDGKEPSNDSNDYLIVGEEFICLSYKTEIVRWLENCIKEMANKPIIRESLNQYLVLVKQLTNQSTNKKMENEIINFIAKDEFNLKSAQIVFDNYSKTLDSLKRVQINKMIEIFINNGIQTNSVDSKRSGRNDGAFLVLKSFKLDDKITYDLGINIELDNAHFFFCVIESGKSRNDKWNQNNKFSSISNFLHSKINNLNIVTGWTIGKSNDFVIDINPKEYYYPNTDNSEAFIDLAKRFLEFYQLLNNENQ